MAGGLVRSWFDFPPLFGLQSLPIFRLGQKVIWSDDTFTCLNLQLFPRLARYATAFAGRYLVLAESLCVLFPGNLRGGSFTEHGEDQFKVVHMVTQVFP